MGKVYRFHIHGPGNFNERSGWQIWKKYGGGALTNLGVHLIDTTMFILEEKVVEVFAQLNKIVDKGDTEDSFNVILKLENGCMAECEITKAFYNNPHWFICGTKGSVIGDFDPLPVMKLKAQYVFNGKTEEISESFDFAHPRYTSQTLAHYAELVKALNSGKTPPVSIDSAITTMRVIDAAKKSSGKISSIKI